jgi:hypothetical protein
MAGDNYGNSEWCNGKHKILLDFIYGGDDIILMDIME